jgi:hypothetical protein
MMAYPLDAGMKLNFLKTHSFIDSTNIFMLIYEAFIIGDLH